MKLIVIYCYIVIFCSWILRLAHFPQSVGFAIINIIDLLPLLLSCFLFNLSTKKTIAPNTVFFWILVLFFLSLSIVTTIIHNGRVQMCIMHFGIIFRFVPLALFLSMKRVSDDDVSFFIKHFVYISVIILIIGYIEIIGGQASFNLFVPLVKENSSANVVLDKELENGIFGIFANSVDMSYFLVISYIIINYTNSLKANRLLIFCIYLIAIYMTGSKCALMCFLLSSFIGFPYGKSFKYTFIGIVLAVGVYLLYEFWELFIWTVFIDSQASRLGIILFTLPYFLAELSLDTLIGVGPDRDIVFNKINSYPDTPIMTRHIEAMTAFEDEFYVAIIIYYGIIGFMILLYIYYNILCNLIKTKWIDNRFNYISIMKGLSYVLLIAPLFNQIIIIKTFSLFFWIIIGLFYNIKNNQQSVNGLQNKQTTLLL